MNAAALLSALPPPARAALVLARRWYPAIDPTDAWLVWASRPTASTQALAARLCSDARREWHADRRFAHIEADPDSAGLSVADPAGDPLAQMLAAEAAAEALAAPGAAGRLLLADWTDLDTTALAERDRCTRRRVQQVRAQVLAAAAAGQQCLFA